MIYFELNFVNHVAEIIYEAEDYIEVAKDLSEIEYIYTTMDHIMKLNVFMLKCYTSTLLLWSFFNSQMPYLSNLLFKILPKQHMRFQIKRI